MADGGEIRIRPRALRRKKLADLWCGAGGTSTGADRAMRELGLPYELVAVNHWPTAIETHKRNHPEHAPRTHCADLESARPLALVPEGYLDLLMASPTCTFHSRARGGKPVNDQQRMDPWHVVRWCTELRVKRFLIENVPEFVDWGPCSLVTGRPIPSRKGEYFRAWCDALKAIGFRIEIRVINCADHGDPTTRRRFFMQGRSDGKRIRWPEATHAREATVDLLGSRARWNGAAQLIDWHQPGTSIFTRKRPLKPNTIRRILAGAIKYLWPRPYIDALQALLDDRPPVLDLAPDQWERVAPFGVHFRGTSNDAIARSAIDLGAPLPTLTAGGGHIGLIMATGAGGVARELADPLPTVTAGGQGGARPHYITPILLPTGAGPAKDVDAPLPTITTGGAGSEEHRGNARPALVAPYYGGGSGRTAQSVHDPLPTVTTKARFGLVEPVVLSTSNSSSAGVPRSVAEPLRTITTAKGGDMAFAAPILMRAAHGDSDGRDPASRLLDSTAPLPALTGSNEVSIAHPSASGGRIDILYRMLNYRELARGTSLDDEGTVYDFAGTNTDITKQIGNAVPCRTAKALVRSMMEDE